MAGTGTAPAEVPAQAKVVVTRTQRFCMTKIKRGRYKGRTCVNAYPCMEHDIMPRAYSLQALGPDEYPLGFYIEMARQQLRPEMTMTARKRKTYQRWSVLR